MVEARRVGLVMAGPFTRISLKYSMIEEEGLSILEKFALARELGFDGVELDAPNALPLAEVLAARDATGLAIPGVVNADHWRTPLTDPDPEKRQNCVRSVIAALETARDYGASTVLLVPGVVNETTSYAEAYARSREGIAALLPHAERTGVAIALENVWNGFLLSPLEAADFVDSFEHPLIGWYFDVGNVLRHGWPVHWIEVLGKRILKVDLKEFSLSKMREEGLMKGFDVPLGGGDCNWPAVNRAFAAIGYEGWASVEVPGGGRARIAAIREEVGRVLAT